ncbi:MAG TPA: MarR family transcriptional regulator [Actinomycetota bacterium]|nr:MarR family transcriptional regulator [Actinomycetota bacterium]
MAAERGPKRFKELMRRAKRDWAASKVVVGILRADSKAAQALERGLAEVGLTLPQFNVLMVLAASASGSLALFELNAQLVSTPPNTTWLTNRMQERGLVVKERDAEDGRVVLLELTELGWEALATAAPLVFDAEKELLARFTRSELNTLGDLLTRLLQ